VAAPRPRQPNRGGADATANRSEPLLLKVRAPDVQAAVTVLGRRIEVSGEVIELQNVDLRSAYLGNANLRSAIIGRAMLALADLEKADLTNAWLRRTNFRGADMKHAILRGAVRQDTILSGADLYGADLSGANFHNAKCDDDTVWPREFNWKAAGVKHQPKAV
jgi:Pentapeptide repeats (8 copies)